MHSEGDLSSLCSVCFSQCFLDCGGEIIPPVHEKNCSEHPSSHCWGQEFALPKVGKRDVLFFFILVLTDLCPFSHSSPIWKAVRKCWGSAILQCYGASWLHSPGFSSSKCLPITCFSDRPVCLVQWVQIRKSNENMLWSKLSLSLRLFLSSLLRQ